MPIHSVSEVMQKLAKHPEGFTDLFRRMGYVPLLPLLELSHRDVAQSLRQSFREAGLREADFERISLRDLLVFALRSESNYWVGLAVRWLADGFPIDEAIVRAGDEMVESKRGTQADRHMLFKLIRRYERYMSKAQERELFDA
jgi:hypothetical protein